MDYEILDYVKVKTPCKNCGSVVFIVDAPNIESTLKEKWLLCLDPLNIGCVETRSLEKSLNEIELCKSC